jgi:hypothetical protein
MTIKHPSDGHKPDRHLKSLCELLQVENAREDDGEFENVSPSQIWYIIRPNSVIRRISYLL